MNFQADQRAWVGIKSFEIIASITPEKSMHMNINVINTGKTPAREVKLLECGTGDTEAATLEWKCPLDDEGIVAPGGQWFFASSSDPVSQLYVDRLTAGVQRTYYRGVIQYKDIFDKIHSTRFCAYYAGSSATNFLACPHGNDMN